MANDEPSTADEWIKRHQIERIEDLRKQARRLYGKSVMLQNTGDKEGEVTARNMLATAASAFWNSEDTELEPVTHDEMDQYGRWVRECYGCWLAYEAGSYYQRCPIAIAHKRVGMSIGFTARSRICSICGEDFVECPHSSSQLYEVKGGVGPSGYCPVCGKPECEAHSPEQTYRVPPMRIVTEIATLHEISLVRKPAQPDARLTSIPVDISSLRQALGASFSPGDRVSCDRCLNECRGIEEIPSLR
jgi:hypothetical protein